MKYLLIGTTAINRSLLHKDTITDWYNWMNKLEGYKKIWFINIDIIDKLEESCEVTKNNFRNIIKDIDIVFLGNKKGNFLKACKTISEEMELYIEKNKIKENDALIFWLEDDWKLNLNITIPINEIINNYLTEDCHINLSFIRNNYIHALAPSLITYKLWKRMHLEAWKQQEEHIDPESCVGKFVIKKMGIKEDNINNLTIITKYKKLGGVTDKHFNYENSYYTFDDEKNRENLMTGNRFIKKENIRAFFGDKMLFVRITNNFCIDGCNYGRNFMEKNNLYKKRVQNEKNKDFYK